MSGPKTSRYTLTEAQRRAILEQIRIAQEKIIRHEKEQSERDVLKYYCNNIKAIIVEIEDVLKQVEKTIAEGKLNTIDLSEFSSNCDRAKNEIAKANIVVKDGELESLQGENRNLNDIVQKLENDRNAVYKILKNEESNLRDTMLSKLVDGFNISFVGIGNRNALKNSEYLPMIIEALDSIKNTRAFTVFKDRYDDIRNKANEITDIDFLGNYYSISVLPFVKQCKEYEVAWEKYGEDYQNLLIRYKVISREVGVGIDSVEFSENAVSELLTKISDLERVLLERKEESYICQCIDESMEELGYKVVGSREVTKKSGKHFRNELYKFDEGAVVNVTYSDDGQITMELGAVDNESRIPTDAESKSLVEDMTTFCGEYSELEKKLKEKGVETKRISILPPHSEYAQIIDISDYDMKESVGEYSYKKANMSGNQVLHREV